MIGKSSITVVTLAGSILLAGIRAEAQAYSTPLRLDRRLDSLFNIQIASQLPAIKP